MYTTSLALGKGLELLAQNVTLLTLKNTLVI